jgi:fucose 4-O-acetylase-like acetyltransferase
MEQRVEFLDIIKAFAIFCVVWGHSVQYLYSSDFLSNKVFEFIYSFHMPLFMILSGYFFRSSLKLSFIKLLFKKFQQLILPIITWSILICLFTDVLVFSTLQNIFNTRIILLDFINIISDLFWFFKCVFLCYLISHIGLKLIKNEFLASLIIMVLFLFIFQSITYGFKFLLPYFWVGIFLRKYFYIIDKYNIKSQNVTLILFAFLLYFWKGKYTIYFSPIPEIIDFKTFSIYLGSWKITLLRYLIGFVGSLFFITFIKNISNSNFQGKKYLTLIGRYTLEIYILQWLILQRGISLWKVSYMNKWIFNFLFTPIISIVVIFSCYILIKIIEKNNILNLFLLGKVNNQSKA